MLKRLTLALVLSTALVSANSSQVQAGPAIAAVAAFAATPLGGFVVNLGISLVSKGIGTLIQNLTGSKQSSKSAGISGVRGQLQGGDDTPCAFIMGDRATGGSIAYHGRWGTVDKTPNAYHVEERILSDVPMPNPPGLWVGEQKVTVLWGDPETDQGFPIQELRVDDVDHGWVRYYDGTQTTADPYMRAKFGAHATRPYLADMIGRGQAKAIVTLLVDRTLFKGTVPALLFVSDGIAQYDISKDTTAGGSGSHRVDDPATWEPSNILPVLIFNILRGIRWGDEWVWGMQDTPAARLPASSWIAAINEARSSTLKADGSHEPQFAGGYEITCDMEPQGVIKELIKGCLGRISEVGGVYKMLCGVPASPVFSFTDANVLVTRELGFDPWPSLDATVNGISASYPDPSARWQSRDAPARYSPGLETIDLGKQLLDSPRYEVVNSVTQVQRLSEAAIADARRFRRHTLYLPPIASELEPLDMVSWTSAKAGYTNKKFLVGAIDDTPTYIDRFDLQEIDPGDFDYTAADDELPFTVGLLSSSRPPAQAVADWAVAPYVILNSDGEDRSPAIKMFWNGGQPDVRGLLYEVRLAADESMVVSGEFVSQFALGNGTTPAGTLLSSEDYEARGKYEPFGPRETAWSEWTSVTTPNVALLPPGSVTSTALNKQLRDAVGFVLDAVEGSVRSLEQRIEDALDRLGGSMTTNTMASDRDRKILSAAVGEVEAAIVEEASVRASADTALSQFVLDVAAQAASGLAEGLFTVRAEAAPEGVTVRLALLARVTTLVDYIDTGILIDLSPVGDGYASKILFKADSIYFTDGEVTTIPMVFEDGALKLNVANIGTVNAGKLQGSATVIDLDAPGFFSFGIPS